MSKGLVIRVEKKYPNGECLFSTSIRGLGETFHIGDMDMIRHFIKADGNTARGYSINWECDQ